MLADESREVETDVLGCGDDAAANAWTIDRADEIPGMRGMDAGPLRLARHVEGCTAQIVSINMRYKTHAGVRVTRLSETGAAWARRLMSFPGGPSVSRDGLAGT
ncbi:MAG: hypothetical protein M3O65_12755, partial [Actinomycetota bacterium]|nr:hypothetical protein [Actinomycetota bacterium]